MTAGPQSPESSAEFMPATVFDYHTAEVSRNYADALLNVGGQAGETDAALEELESICRDVLAANPRFAAILASPATPTQEKDRILVDAFEGKAMPTVTRFLRVMNRHGRLAILPEVVRQARVIWDRRQGRKPVTVRSAVPLDEGQQAAVRDRLAALIQATPVLTLEVDPSLIGGLVVQVGDDVYDASVRNRLGRLRDRLIERKSHEIPSR
ncbi:ATP synthase F1 subunit delta [Tundrisphaera sp. TA3]|uniref:ATP synthase F1 subunit delta n=1 Tax=Tundrisphaera sp. TA3 TaxID=3435775 RepID=UPI003EBE3329